MPDGWMEWGAAAQIAGALVTGVLAVGTLLAAIAALRAARIAERDFRASRLPVTAVTWTDCVRQDEKLFTLARVKNVSPGPIVLHRARTGAASVFHGGSIPLEEHGGIERTLQVNDEYHIPLEMSVSDADVAKAARMGVMVANSVIYVDVSVFGVGDTEETWGSFGFVRYSPEQGGQFRVEGRVMTHAAQDNSYRGRLKRAFQKWNATLERWEREMA